MTVLFVDDDVDDREFFMDALSYVDSQITCLLAKNCEQALDMLNATEPLPGYVFLDIHMPAMDGKGCLTQIKNNPRLRSVRVVMYSTTSDEELMGLYKELGATYFLVKPPTFKGLCDSLAVLIER
jgi:CheY-like chemotaxis protein